MRTLGGILVDQLDKQTIWVVVKRTERATGAKLPSIAILKEFKDGGLFHPASIYVSHFHCIQFDLRLNPGLLVDRIYPESILNRVIHKTRKPVNELPLRHLSRDMAFLVEPSMRAHIAAELWVCILQTIDIGHVIFGILEIYFGQIHILEYIFTFMTRTCASTAWT